MGTALLTLPLIMVGGGVTSKDAGMVYPTAPLSDGALINPTGWLDQTATRLEHGHRLLGWCVGILATASAVLACFVERRRGVRWLAVGVLGGICLQGGMGIWRVNFDSIGWAILHGVWGQACFAAVACLALVTSDTWHTRLTRVETNIAPVLRLTCCLLLLTVVVQLVLGVLNRQTQWGLAWHVLTAMAVTFLVARVTFLILADIPPVAPLRKGALVLALLVGLQLMLGLSSLVVTGGSSAAVLFPSTIQWIVPTAHVFVGALILAGTLGTTAMCFRAVHATAGEAVSPAKPDLTTA